MVKRFVFMLKRAFSRWRTHPRPWILRYSLSFGPAFVFSLLITMSSWQILSQPYMSQLLDQRNIDVLFDILLNIGESERNLLLPFMMIALAGLVWVPVQIASLWLEGGTLCSYTSDKPIEWSDFLHACNRWFGFMFVVKGIGALLTTGILISTVVIGFVIRFMWSPLMWVVICVGVLINVSLYLLLELARAVAVVQEERHLGRVLQSTVEIIKNEAVSLLILLTIALFSTLLLLFQRWISTTVPVLWWLLSFLILQVVAIARHGLRLIRRSIEITYAQIQIIPNPNTS